eukprot:TRINITY_DN96321_c0_g1_i1.p1 TRINITY_DN96321_c0_g1~~TRINITY_DN96321_c0_g1_i1.p1  ORF type:complete len:178 (+),score=19.48 TRINITY_DN96321_c0_g1_i1:82-615(+)
MPEVVAPFRKDDWPDRRCFIIIREGHRKPSKRIDAAHATQSAPFEEAPLMYESFVPESAGHGLDTPCAVNGFPASPSGRGDAGLKIEVASRGRPVFRSASMSQMPSTPSRLRPSSSGLLGTSKTWSPEAPWQRGGRSKATKDGFGERIYMQQGGLPQKKPVYDPPEPLPKSKWREWP